MGIFVVQRQKRDKIGYKCTSDFIQHKSLEIVYMQSRRLLFWVDLTPKLV